MVSIKNLTLLTLSVSAVSAMPQYAHARFHFRRAAGDNGLSHPVSRDSHNHDHQPNDTETGPVVELHPNPDSNQQIPAVVGHLAERQLQTSCLSTVTESVTSVQVATVTAPLRRWDHSYPQGGWGGGNPWTQGQYTPAAAQPSADPVGVSVGVSVGLGSGSTMTASADMPGSTASAEAPDSTASGSTVPTGSTSGSSSGKKGLSYNSNSLLNQFSSADASWAYNWAAGAGGSVPSDLEFVPMLWGTDSIPSWASAVKAAIASGSKHALSFNEPDLSSQSNIDPQTAAQLHIANMAPLAGQVQIGSPAITNSNAAGQGLNWMSSFLSACGGTANNCKLDFLALHWYNSAGEWDDFTSHISQALDLANQNGISKVWVTEFAVNGAISDQASFLEQALPWLDSQSGVERYAYFMVGNGQLLTNNALNAAGQAYAS